MLAAAILPGIIAAVWAILEGTGSISSIAQMYHLVTMNTAAFAMMFRGPLRGEEFAFLLPFSPFISAALASNLFGAAILHPETVTSKQGGTQGIGTAFLAYTLHTILSIALAFLIVGQGAIGENTPGVPGMIFTFLVTFIISLIAAAIPLILMGFIAGWLLHRLFGNRAAAEPAIPAAETPS